MSADPPTVDGTQAGVDFETRLCENGGHGRFPFVAELILFRANAGLDQHLIGLGRLE